MKRSAIVVCLLFVASVSRASALGSFTKWLGDRPINIGAMTTLDGKTKGIGYTDLLQYGQKGLALGENSAKPYIDFGLGARLDRGLLVLFMIHPVNLFGRWYEGVSWKDRLKVTPLPDVVIGPTINVPLGDWSRWKGSENIGIAYAYRFE